MSSSPTAAAATSALASHKVLYTRAAATGATGDSGALTHTARRIAVDVRFTAIGGTGPSVTPRVDRLGSDGNWYTIWTGTAITAVGNQSTSIGPGCTVPQLPVGQIRVGWVVAGTPTFAVSVAGI